MLLAEVCRSLSSFVSFGTDVRQGPRDLQFQALGKLRKRACAREAEGAPWQIGISNGVCCCRLRKIESNFEWNLIMTDQFATYPSLSARVVLVTGGASGIGASIVEHLVAQGSKVGFIDIDKGAAELLLGRLKGPGSARFRCADLRDIEQLRQAILRLTSELGGPFTVLVNNAARDDRHA